MSILLTQGNVPPNSTEASLDAQIKGSTQEAMILSNHELWSNAGHSLGGINYSYAAFAYTSTSYGKYPTNSVMDLESFAPLVNLEHVRENGDAVVTFFAFVQNANIQITIQDFEYGFSISSNVSATSGSWQWISGSVTITAADLVGYGSTWIGTFEIKRLTYDTTGYLRQLFAKVIYRSSTDIPR